MLLSLISIRIPNLSRKVEILDFIISRPLFVESHTLLSIQSFNLPLPGGVISFGVFGSGCRTCMAGLVLDKSQAIVER